MAKILATFRIEETDWQAFKDLADSRGSNASSELVKYVLGSLGRIDAESLQTVDLDAKIDERLDTLLDRKIESAIASLRSEIQNTDKKIEFNAQQLDKAIGSLWNEIEPLLEANKELTTIQGKSRA